MFLYFLAQHLNGLLTTLKGHRLQNVEQALVGELFLLAVLCLVKTVGIDEQRTVGDVGNLFAFVVEFRPQADRTVGYHLDELCLAVVQQHGRIMTGITEVEVSRL